MPNVMIREYIPDDMDALIAIWANADAAAHPFLPIGVKDQVREDMANIYLPKAETWILEEDGIPIGFIAMIENEIGGLFVDPAHHGKGFGRRLVDHVVSLKGPLGVQVFKDNKLGVPFYERYGFITTGESVFEPSGHVLIMMEMPTP